MPQPTKKAIIRKLEAERDRLNKTYGDRTGAIGSDDVKLKVYPSGILALDYALGTGGWPRGQMIEIFGPEDIGKSSAIGNAAIRGAQSQGALCGIIAVEPNFDKKWVEKNGVDPSLVAISRPNNAEDAFNILYDWVKGDLFDLIVFDSIGALLKGTEIEVDSNSGKKNAKPSAMGQAGVITWGLKRIAIPTWKQDKVVMLLNQVRDVTDAQHKMYDSPGGHALKHLCAQRIQLKHKDKTTAKIDGDSVVVNREIIADVVRNKLAEGTRQRGIFVYHQKDWEDDRVGIDLAEDVIRTGKKTGVVHGSSYLTSEFWEGKLHGRPAVKRWIADNPKGYEQLRSRVIEVMIERQGNPNFQIDPEEALKELDENND
jgi:recombination protein RecA